MKQVTVDAYLLQELPDDVQEKIINERVQSNAEIFSFDDIIEDVAEALEVMGFEVDKHPHRNWGKAIYFDTHAGHFSMSGLYHYKPGAVKKLKSDRPTDTELHNVAQSLVDAQQKHFYKLWAMLSHPRQYTSRITIEHDDRPWDSDFPELKEAIEDVYNWAFGLLEREYEWYTSSENAKEQLEEEGALYLIDGTEIVKERFNEPMQAPNAGPAGEDFGGKEPICSITIHNYDGRGVVHFLSVLTDTEKEEHCNLFGDEYGYAVRKTKAHVKKYYGDHNLVKKFHNKRYGGGIIFDLPYQKIREICSVLSEQEGIVK